MMKRLPILSLAAALCLIALSPGAAGAQELEGVERLAVSVSVVQQRDGSWLFSSWRQCHGPR